VTFSRKVIKTLWKPKPARGIEKDGSDYKQLLISISSNPNIDRRYEVRRLMEHFCWLYAHRKKIPPELQRFIGKAFADHINQEISLEKAFGLTKSTRGPYKKYKNDQYAEDYIQFTFYKYINSNCSRYRAELLASRKFKVPRQTIHSHCDEEENKIRGILGVFVSIEMNEGKLTKHQVKRIKELIPEFVYRKSIIKEKVNEFDGYDGYHIEIRSTFIPKKSPKVVSLQLT